MEQISPDLSLQVKEDKQPKWKMQSDKPMPKESPEQKVEEERRYISAWGVINTVFHAIYIINQCLDKPIEY